MNQLSILWPMLAQVLLVYLVYLVLGVRRYGAIRTGVAKAQAFKLRSTEPEMSVTAANNVINQFELPVLFYVACLSYVVTDKVTAVPLVLAWLFVISRYVHAYVHVTTNKLLWRSRAFRVGWVLLLVLWLWFAFRLAAG